MSKVIGDELVLRVEEWLGDEGADFFGSLKRDYGTVAPVLGTNEEQVRYGVANPLPLSEQFRIIPYPVHFRDGMKVRNFMRSTGLCEGWDAHDFDDLWTKVVEMAIDRHLPSPVTDSEPSEE